MSLSRAFCPALLSLLAATVAAAADLPKFDFTKPGSASGWVAAHDVGPLETGPDGLLITITGGDPYIMGPARDYPEGEALWLTIRIRPDVSGGGQVFYYRDAPNPGDSAGFYAKGGEWQTVKMPLPPLGPGYHIRLDPPGVEGRSVVSAMEFQPRVALKEPAWKKPSKPDLSRAITLRSGELELKQSRTQAGAFALTVAGRPMAIGWDSAMIGYVHGGKARWVDLAKARVTAGASFIEAAATDPDGGKWTYRQSFKAVTGSKPGGAIEVTTAVSVDRDRAVSFLPMLVLLPGAGSFGESKGQALLPGLEYLDNEPSRSEADIRGPLANRRVPDPTHLCFPLMAVQADGRWVGVIWERRPEFSALFDSPDRTFGSGGHLMGVFYPGTDGLNREQGSLLPYEGETVAAGRKLSLKARLIGGRGDSIVPAVRHYVENTPAASLKTPMGFQDYARLAAGGWLDSKIREGALVRHAFWPGFGPGRAADAAVAMEWLASQTSDAALSARLLADAREVIGAVNPQDYLTAHISHVPAAVPPLVYGHVPEAAARAAQSAKDSLKRFDSQGRIIYEARAGGLDYGETHFAPDANGLTAGAVVSVLDMAALSGDRELIRQGIERLRGLDRFTNSVPRGAQTWEIPLHTPDILASAHLVKAYMLGYELTGEAAFLEKAKHWAWTGVTFVYLTPPLDAPVGLYSTIPVLGGTAWVGSWFGRPVQWCGLVYADALFRLMRYDKDPVWKTLTDGILASGIQQTFPLSDKDRQGLLPDFYLLRPQVSDGPAINPATLQVNIAHLYGRPLMGDFRALRRAGLLVHAPGEIDGVSDSAAAASFTVRGWAKRPYYVLINGLKSRPRVKVNGKEAVLTGDNSFDAASGRLVLKVSGQPRIELSLR